MRVEAHLQLTEFGAAFNLKFKIVISLASSYNHFSWRNKSTYSSASSQGNNFSKSRNCTPVLLQKWRGERGKRMCLLNYEKRPKINSALSQQVWCSQQLFLLPAELLTGSGPRHRQVKCHSLHSPPFSQGRICSVTVPALFPASKSCQGVIRTPEWGNIAQALGAGILSVYRSVSS